MSFDKKGQSNFKSYFNSEGILKLTLAKSGQDWLSEKQQLLKKINELEKELKNVKKINCELNNKAKNENNIFNSSLGLDRK